MSLRTGHAKIIRAGKELFASWDRTKPSWRDENRRQFEQKYLEPLRKELDKTLLAMDQMDLMFNRLHTECK